MKKLSSISIILISATLISCTTTSSGPIPAGENTYVISRQEGAFPTGNKPLLAEALAEANIFCVGKNQTMKLINTHENQGPFILFNYPKATVTFSCIEKSATK